MTVKCTPDMKADSNLMLTNRKAYCMKRFVIGASLAVMSFVSCMEEVAAPVAVSRDLYAQIEQEEITRTVMDADNNIRWSEGDQVVAFMKSSLGVKYQIKDEYVGKTSGYFSMVSSGSSTDIGGGMELDHNIVFYPYPIAAECEKSGLNYNLNVVLPVEQSYAPESFGNGSFPMVAVSGNTNLTFRNVLGGMKLQLKGTGKISSIRVEGKNGERLSGEATVTAYTDEETGPSITMASSASTSVSLNCGGVQLDEDTATEFIIALPPVTLADGFTVTVTDADGNEQSIESDKSNEIRRSALLVMPEITLDPEEPESQEGDYIDEYGINHGPGLNGGVWAPVNCGYKARVVDEYGVVIDKGYPSGKSYQYGRRWGFGVLDRDASLSMESDEPVTIDVAQSESYDNTIITSSDYILGDYDDLWNLGTEEEPLKSEYDPCPDGWRVPTYKELNALARNDVWWWTNSDLGTKGFALAFDDGTVIRFDRVCRCSLPDEALVSWYGDYVTMSSQYRDKSLLAVRCRRDDRGLIPVSEVSFPMESLELKMGDTYAFEVTITPSNANHQYAYWYSDDPSVVTFDRRGVAVAIAEGTTIVNAVAGLKTAKCRVTVKGNASASGGYVDEYGINHGRGVEIDGIVWAPVNCGYHKEDFRFGKLYQWGRKYGQGYNGDLYGSKYATYSDAMAPSIEVGGVSAAAGNDENKSDVFFTGASKYNYDWADPEDDTLWNSGTEENPVKTEYDPCPDGWRVPTGSELKSLQQSGSSLNVNVAGFISYNSGNGYGRGYKGLYWSSAPVSKFAESIAFDSMYEYLYSSPYSYRAEGHSVRCVQE